MMGAPEVEGKCTRLAIMTASPLSESEALKDAVARPPRMLISCIERSVADNRRVSS